MNKAFEEILDNLNQIPNEYRHEEYNKAIRDVVRFIEIYKEKNNGWIPCSERLPSKEEYLKDDGRFVVTDGNRRYQSIYDIYTNKFRTLHNDLLKSWEYTEDELVIAWQPLPEPYKER